MPKLEVVCNASEDEQHSMDGEAVCVYKEKVFTGADDGKIKVWDHHTLKLLHEFEAHEYAVTDLLVLGDTLFSCGVDAIVKSWDANNYASKNANIGTHEESIRKLATDGTTIFAGDEKGDVKEYSVDGSSKGEYNLVEEVWGLLAKDDLIYSVRDRGLTISHIRDESKKVSVVSHVEGRAPIVIVGDNLICINMSGMNIIVRENTKPFKVKAELKGHELIITALAGHGKRIASTGYDNLLKLWDINTLKEITSCPLPACANAMAFSDDGCIFVTGSGGYLCKLKET